MTTPQNRQQITHLLSNNICKLAFNTIEGKPITTQGTRITSHIPEGSRSITEDTSAEEANGTIAFYDIVEEKVRSFKIENLTDIQVAA